MVLFYFAIKFLILTHLYITIKLIKCFLKQGDVIMENYKVIIWGLGHVGKAAVRQLVQRKSLELVAVYDTDPSKIGQDSGVLSGVEPTGILVNGDGG